MERPNLEFTLKLNGEDHTIKMTYGLFQEILQVVPDPENIGGLLLSDVSLRDYLVRRCLTGNKRVTKEEDLIDLFSMDVDLEDTSDLLVWIGDHVMYFFMNSAAKTASLGEKYEKLIAQLSQSNSGAKN